MSRSAQTPEPKGLIFIVGFPRSGTTMLRTVLRGHPELNTYGTEPHFILDLYREFGLTIRDTPRAARVIDQSEHTTDDYPRVPLLDVVSEGEMPLRDLLYLYFSLLFDRFSERPLLLKLPAMAAHLDLLAEVFPEARVINVVRDPRAAVASHRARWPGGSFIYRVHEWLSLVRVPADRPATSAPPIVTIRYEDLLRDPEPTLMRVCEAVGLPFSRALMNVDYILPQWDPNRPGVPSFNHFKGFATDKIHQWQSVLSAEEIRLIERLCAREMSIYGYEALRPAVNPVRYAVFRCGQFLRQPGRFASSLVRGARESR